MLGKPARIVNVSSLGQHPIDFDDVILHVAPIPMPLPKHGKRSRRCENGMAAPYSFLAKRCMPAGIWARSRRRWPADGRRRRRFSPPDDRRTRQQHCPLLGMTHSRPAGYFHPGGQRESFRNVTASSVTFAERSFAAAARCPTRRRGRCDRHRRRRCRGGARCSDRHD
jgi:hypothetical protein